MGSLITIEGLDCAGKTSVIIPYLQKHLNSEEFVFLADMKSGDVSKGIRNIFMDPKCITEKTDWTTIAMLASAARSDMVVQDIIPALNENKIIFCDRYVDTSYVYNLKSHTSIVSSILDASTHDVYPDFVIFAYCSYEEMIKRKNQRDDNDHWDLVSKEQYDEKLNRYKNRLYNSSNKGYKPVVFEIDSTNGVYHVYKELDKLVDLLKKEL